MKLHLEPVQQSVSHGFLASAAAALTSSTSSNSSRDRNRRRSSGATPPVSNSPAPFSFKASKCYNDGYILLIYANCIQLWKLCPTTQQTLDLVGSIDVMTRIIDADLLTPKHCIIQYENTKGAIGVAAHAFRSGSASFTSSSPLPPCPPSVDVSPILSATSSSISEYGEEQTLIGEKDDREDHGHGHRGTLIETLDIPPVCAAPYTIRCLNGSSEYFSVIGANGRVCIYSSVSFARCIVSPLVSFNSAGLPLFALSGRWMAFQETDDPNPAASLSSASASPSPLSPSSSPPPPPALSSLHPTRTPVNLPPQGPLYERIMETVSSTALASLKTLSDKSYEGIRNYWAKSSSASSSAYNDSSNGQNGSEFHSGPNSFKNSSTSATTAAATSTTTTSLEKLKLLFSSTKPIVVIDIPTGRTIGRFPPLGPVSYLSLSPYDATLATISSRGDYICTYDLTCLPSQVSLTGKYVRGKVPAEISTVVWGNHGSFGIITKPRGSVHWFDKTLSFDNTSKRLWKHSAWQVTDMAFVPNRRNGDSCLLIIQDNLELSVCDSRTGSVLYGIDLPLKPVTSNTINDDSSNVTGTSPDDDQIDLHNNNDNSFGSSTRISSPTPDPLSFFELETCLPYPFLHTDRHITFSTLDKEDITLIKEKDGRIVIECFGGAIRRTPLYFGAANGTTDLGDNDNTELQSALEGVLIE